MERGVTTPPKHLLVVRCHSDKQQRGRGGGRCSSLGLCELERGCEERPVRGCGHHSSRDAQHEVEHAPVDRLGQA